VVIENFTFQNTSSFDFLAPAVHLSNVRNVTIQNVRIRNAGYGVQITSSNSTRILYCNISKTVWALYLRQSSNNIISYNTLEKNQKAIGILTLDCQFNKIHHNNFINNTEHIPPAQIGSNNSFDDGYPSGGNYWSNYSCVDEKKGPYQNQLGSDGILDEAYPDPLSRWDRYPLIHPIVNIEFAADGDRFMVQVATNSTLTGCSLNQSARSLTLFVDGSTDTNGSCRVTVPKGLLSSDSPYDWTVIVYNNNDGGQTIPYWASEDSYNTYFYFAYNHSSTRKIEIIVPEGITLTTLLFLAVVVTLIIFGKGLKQEEH